MELPQRMLIWDAALDHRVRISLTPLGAGEFLLDIISTPGELGL
jgi:hypothetical protein